MSPARMVGASMLTGLALCLLSAQGTLHSGGDEEGKPSPVKPRRPILPLRPRPPEPAPGPSGKAQVGGTISPDGTEEINCDLDKRFHLRNRGGSDGAGLCVFASLKHSSIWQHVWQTQMIFEWMFKYPGGGYPAKVDKVIAQICKEKGQPVPPYFQIESRDLTILKLACKTGRMPGITYNFSPTGRYGGSHISHMVSLVHASDKWFVIIDNNYPGSIEWMDPETFLRVYAGSGNGWAVVFLNDAPPPPPRNQPN
jgi:hypothetical protein